MRSAKKSIFNQPLHLPLAVTRRWLVVPLGIYVLSCLFLVASAILAAPVSRFLADDWALAENARRFGIIGAARNNYLTWGGRFSSNLIDASLGYWGTWTAPVFATLFTIAFLIGIYALVKEALHLLTGAPSHFCALATLMFLGSLLYTLADIGANFAWFTGIATYTLPILIFCISLTAILRRARGAGESNPPSPVFFATLALAGFFASGCSEVIAVAQISLLAIAGLFAILHSKGSYRRCFCVAVLCAVIGAVAGLALFYIAPGNAVRIEFSGGHRPAAQAVSRSWNSSTRFYMTWVLEQWLLLGAMFAILGLFCKPLKPLPPKTTLLTIAATGILTRLLLVLYIFPACYGSGIALPTRAHIILYIVVFAWAAASGFALGLMAAPLLEKQNETRQAWLTGLVLMMLAYQAYSYPLAYFLVARSSLSGAHAFARAWDEREALPLGHPGRLSKLSAWGVHDYTENLINRDRYGVR